MPRSVEVGQFELRSWRAFAQHCGLFSRRHTSSLLEFPVSIGCPAGPALYHTHSGGEGTPLRLRDRRKLLCNIVSKQLDKRRLIGILPSAESIIMVVDAYQANGVSLAVLGRGAQRS
jgi:hypothetical protein